MVVWLWGCYCLALWGLPAWSEQQARRISGRMVDFWYIEILTGDRAIHGKEWQVFELFQRGMSWGSRCFFFRSRLLPMETKENAIWLSALDDTIGPHWNPSLLWHELNGYINLNDKEAGSARLQPLDNRNQWKEPYPNRSGCKRNRRRYWERCL